MPALAELKAKAKELALRIPYQLIKDSPTVKYYTKWEVFDKCVESSNHAKASINLPWISEYDAVISNGELIKGQGLVNDEAAINIDVSESRILARHVANLTKVYSLGITGNPGRSIKIALIYSGDANEMHSNHLVINVDRDSSANVILSIIGNGGCGTNVVEINASDGSTLNLLTYTTNINPSFNLIRVIEGVRANINAYSIIVNGEMTHHREDYVLQGEGGVANVNALEIGLGNSRVDYMVNLIHVGRSTVSNSVTKAIALDSATVIHRGFGRITERGKWSYTNIEGKVFIGSSNAIGMSVPVIMVDTGDVNGARHSASDASIDENQELYLRMRGLSKDEAIKLIVYDTVMGFLDMVNGTFKDDANIVRDHLIKLINV